MRNDPPRFSHLSGDPLLDLLNTVDWRLSPARRSERLATFGDVLDWCHEARLVTADERAALLAADQGIAEAERAAVVALREDAYAALFEADDAAAARLAFAYREAVAAARLADAGTGWDWQDHELTPATPRHRVARALVDLLRRPDLDRLHQCEDAECGWVFLDTSPRRNRRWCATSDCGDRNRSRSYYARQKAARDA